MTKQQDSIFTKIINGEMPSYKIYEDEDILAFLDIYPTQPGHVLVIPKKQIEFVWDIPDNLYSKLMAVTKKIALHMREVLPQKYVSERIVGIDVPHAHVQLIPFDAPTDLDKAQNMNAEPDHDKLAEIAKKLQM